MTKISGTKEWAVATVNCSQGCPNACNYCYSRIIALRRKIIKTRGEWNQHIGTKRNLAAEKKKYKGTVMFPSMHDIHESNLEVCIEVLQNLLSAGNQVLIVSKPRLDCIKQICTALSDYKDNILFRFTIGTLTNHVSTLWEPGAPLPQERVDSLEYAFNQGFRTSVSMEPVLEVFTLNLDVILISQFVTDTIWIGKMNKIRQRVGESIPDCEIQRIEAQQTDEIIRIVYDSLKDNPKIRWKESYKEVLGLDQLTEAGKDE